MTGPGPASRAIRLAVVVVLGLILGGVGYLAIQVAGAPGPRAAEGWSLLAEMPNVRGETAAAVAGGRAYVVGGLAGLSAQASLDVSVYDPASKEWQAGPALPAARHHAAAADLGGAVFVSGGAASAADWTPTVTLWVLAAGGTTWQERAPMPQARLGHRMVALDGKLYVVGGVASPPPGGATEPPAVVDGSVLIYDPATDAWSAGAPMPLSRDHLAVVVVGEEIWAIGGRAGGQNLARVDIYDPVADTWRAGPALPEPTSGAAEGIVNSVILISGGEDPGRGVIVDRHWRLDLRERTAATWRPLAAPPLAVHGGSGVVLDGQFVVVSGSLRPGGQSSTAWTGATQVLLVR